jgi:hypothetical protein
MEAMRNSWTDDRLDDFAAHTVQRFDRLERQMDARFDRMEGRFDRMEGRFDRMGDQFGRLDTRIDQLSQMMFRTMAGLIVTMALGFASLLLAGS